ncbi:class I SAM-dependent methyltransferase [Mucilaginibacter robiniae]|uniref:Class I SAM-dependent methyltransferase n=1 Tax=Mucilaginibacter robiniae TaxID=2728022 RepID=A0A7L5E749_9SPHI|nr:methyltransferase domain-containing protein [Mucilaginibacter robiniae]QJD96196.1 class I SAM-dependent methyltransferase [Mucilaginibacter robiniae]
MKAILDTVSVLRYHKRQIQLHGARHVKALGWRNAYSQLIRFQAMFSMIDLGSGSVLDAGCGHGDLRKYLYDLYPQNTYYGIEQIPELLDVAVERYASYPDTHFYLGDFTTADSPVCDYVLASGSLSYQNSDPDFIFKVIKKLYACCRQGLGFNLLSRVAQQGCLVAYDMKEIMDYCLKLSEKVLVKTDYSEEDFTMFVLK